MACAILFLYRQREKKTRHEQGIRTKSHDGCPWRELAFALTGVESPI